MTQIINELPETLAERAHLCHKLADDAGWWDGLDKKSPLVLGARLALIHSELSEAFEGLLTGAQDDKLPEYPMFFVELADTLIRIYDLIGSQGYNGPARRTLVLDIADGSSHRTDGTALELCRIHLTLSKSLECMRKDDPNGFINNLGLAHAQINCLAQQAGTDLDEYVIAKLSYNQHRADHKREARAQVGGKKI